jgi:hypothetical protein
MDTIYEILYFLISIHICLIFLVSIVYIYYLIIHLVYVYLVDKENYKKERKIYYKL